MFFACKCSCCDQTIFYSHILYEKTFKKLCGPFFGWRSTASRLEPLQGGSLRFTPNFPEIPGTHFIDLGRIKDLVDLETTHSIQFSPLDVCIPFKKNDKII